MTGEGSPEEALESLRLVWPAYFADPARTLPTPDPRISIEAYASLLAVIDSGLDQVQADLGADRVRYHVLAGAGSPIPWGQAAHASAELSRQGSLTVIAGAGHFPWFEVPGCVRAALAQLAAELTHRAPA